MSTRGLNGAGVTRCPFAAYWTGLSARLEQLLQAGEDRCGMSFGSGVMKAVLTWSNQKRTKAMAPASVLARAAGGMSIEGEAGALGLAETGGDGEALLGDADGDGDEIVGVGAAVAPSP